MLSQFFAEHEIAFHHLGFGCGESINVELQLLKQYKASPKIFVFNADPDFFEVKPSFCAQALLDSKDLGTKRIYQNKILHSLIIQLNKIVFFRKAVDEKFFVPGNLIYRDIENGLWVTDAFVNIDWEFNPQFVKAEKCESLSQEEKKRINYWTQQVKEISPDAVIVNTYIPRDTYCPNRLEEVSEYMNVPFFQVEKPLKLQVFDGSHMTPDSAETFTTEFIDFLKKTF